MCEFHGLDNAWCPGMKLQLCESTLFTDHCNAGYPGGAEYHRGVIRRYSHKTRSLHHFSHFEHISLDAVSQHGIARMRLAYSHATVAVLGFRLCDWSVFLQFSQQLSQCQVCFQSGRLMIERLYACINRRPIEWLTSLSSDTHAMLLVSSQLDEVMSSESETEYQF